jgi:hypothetical protein
MAEDRIKHGQRFRDTGAQLFGREGSEWIVQAVFTATDSLQYARVSLAADPTNIKTLSVAVLTDRRRFTLA